MDQGKCHICGAEVTYLKQHIKRVHNKGAIKNDEKECEECGKKCLSATQLKQHWRYMHKVEDAYCKNCDKPFQNTLKLRKHQESCVSNNGKDGTTAISDQNKIVHEDPVDDNMDVDDEFEEIMCNLCGEGYPNLETLKDHTIECLTKMHDDDDPDPENKGPNLPPTDTNVEFEPISNDELKGKEQNPEHNNDEFTDQLEIMDTQALTIKVAESSLNDKSDDGENVDGTDELQMDLAGNDTVSVKQDISNLNNKLNNNEEVGLLEELEENKLKVKSEKIEEDETFAICKLCSKEMKSISIPGHMKNIHGTSDETPCPECQKVFHKESYMRTHLNTAHNSKTTVCPLCAKEMKIISLSGHMRWVHDSSSQNKESKCTECDKIFPNEHYMRAHKNSVHSDEKAVCQICAKEMKLISLKGHMRMVHNSTETECPDCQKMFSSEFNMKSHRSSVHTDEKTMCQICAKELKINSIKGHMRMVHNNNAEREESQCPECYKIFASENYMKIHKSAVHSEKKVVCEVCSEELKEISYKGHMRRHNSCTETQCPECNKIFPRAENMEIHFKEIHKGIKSLCHLCEKTFDNANYLKRHIRTTHSNSKPFFCEDCGKVFKTNGLRKSHISIVHTVDNVDCQYCEKVYKNKQLLGKHVRKYHSEEHKSKSLKFAVKEEMKS